MLNIDVVTYDILVAFLRTCINNLFTHNYRHNQTPNVQIPNNIVFDVSGTKDEAIINSSWIFD